ncbi:MAG: hypothetical protein ACO3PE_03445, partial [Schleiferiaceae bacterium]
YSASKTPSLTSPAPPATANAPAGSEAAVAALAQARAKGFPDAFLVAYRGTARITLDEAEQALKKP